MESYIEKKVYVTYLLSTPPPNHYEFVLLTCRNQLNNAENKLKVANGKLTEFKTVVKVKVALS